MINTRYIRTKIIVLCTILLMDMLIPLNGLSAILMDKVIMKINEEVILKSEFEYEYEQAVVQGNKKNESLKSQILESIILNKMLLAKACLQAIPIPNEEVIHQVEQQIKYLIQQAGSEERLTYYYGKPLVAIKKELKKKIEEMHLINIMTRKIIGNIAASPMAVEKFYHQIPRDKRPCYPSSFEVRQLVVYPTPADIDLKVARKKLIALGTSIAKGETTFEKGVEAYLKEDPTAIEEGLLNNGEECGALLMGNQFPSAIFFVIDKMKQGEVSMPLTYKMVDNKIGLRILFLKQKVAPHEMNLNQDYEKIKNILEKKEKTDRLKQWAKQAKNSFDIAIDSAYKPYISF